MPSPTTIMAADSDSRSSTGIGKRQDRPFQKLQNTIERSGQDEGKIVKTRNWKHRVNAYLGKRQEIDPKPHPTSCLPIYRLAIEALQTQASACMLCPVPQVNAADKEQRHTVVCGCSSTQVVLPESENPSSRRERPFQYLSCTTRERKSIKSLRTAVPVLNCSTRERKAIRSPGTAVPV